jgi:D-tyrosyl-tRNA(Tyr) deacylase
MRAVVQRVSEARVEVDGEIVGEVGHGFMVLLGVAGNDTEADAAWLAEKIANLRVFEDDDGKLNRSLAEAHGAALVVSQFTLLGDCRKGRRPSFSDAAPAELAQDLYLKLAEGLRGFGIPVQTGRFQAMMEVTLTNQGPVTLLLDSKKMF